MLQAIIFDLDGVLIDSEPLMRFAFAASYRQVIGAGEPPIEAYLERGRPQLEKGAAAYRQPDHATTEEVVP